MSAEGLAPSVAANPEFSTCGGYLRKNKEEKQLENMVTQTPDGGFAEESEDVEHEPPPAAVRRKVSFADAFGLNLVSVKEYDNRESSELGDLMALLGAQSKAGEEYHLSCLFTCPASEQELKMRLHQQKLELESIELLPGSTTIRGIIRVLNLCFHKAVYVHTTLDGWQSHFDLLAEFMPGSSDGETDRFFFQLMMTPPFGAEGARVEFCLRYESAAGTFWANNRGTNYVFFCHQRRRTEMKEREREKEREQEKLIEENNQKGIRSCLKTNSKKTSMEDMLTDSSREISEEVTSGSNTESTTQTGAEMTSPKSLKECCKPLVDRRRKRRAVLLAHVQDYFSQKETETQAEISHTGDSATDWLTPTPRSRPIREDVPTVPNQQGHGMDTPPVLMYHEIPRRSLDWGGKTTPPANVKPLDVCNGTTAENQLDPDHNETSASDAWEAFLSATDTTHPHNDTQDQECVPYSGQSDLASGATLVQGTVSDVHEGTENDTSRSGCKGSVDWSDGGILESHPTEKSTGPSKGQDYQPQEDLRVTPTTRAAYVSEEAELELEGVDLESEVKSEGVELEAGPKEAKPAIEAGTEEAELEGVDLESKIKSEGVELEAGPKEAEPELQAGTIEVELEGAELKPKIESEGVGLEAGPQEVGLDLEGCGNCQTPYQENMGGPLCEENTLRSPGEKAHTTHDLQTQNSKVGDEISTEEFTGRSDTSNAEAKVKENTGRAVKDTLTFTGIRDEPLADRQTGIFSEKKDINKSSKSESKDNVEKVEFYSELLEEEKESARRNIETSGLTSETQRVAFNDSDFCVLNTNLKTHNSELQKDEERRLNPIHEPQNLDAEDELPTLPRFHLSWPGSAASLGSNSWLLSWWGLFLSLGHVTRALVYSAIVFVIFVTAYLCDLPTCLALYLFSLGWWCSQGVKQRLDGAVDVELRTQEVLVQ